MADIDVRHDNAAVKIKDYPKGWRLHALTAGLCLSLLLSTLETTIVSTSLVSMTTALGGFGQASWVVTGYFLTYTGFLVIFARLSDFLGTKLLIMVALFFFTVFSIACGSSQSMLQLIIFRSLQGVGGSGIYSLVSVMTPLMVPPAKYATYITIISSVFAISSVLGPLLGGVIADGGTWRWVFWLNGPAGILALAIIFNSIPFTFPYATSDSNAEGYLTRLQKQKVWKRLDYFGAFTSLAASILLVFALEQASTVYAWNSAPIITSFTLSGAGWVAFILWERHLSLRHERKGGKQGYEPLFPWRLACNRFVLGLLLNAFLTGFPFMAAIITIPQRMQVVNHLSAVQAGIRMLPLLLCSPVATALSGFMLSKLRLPPLYMLLAGCILQAVGVGLFGWLQTGGVGEIPASQYGTQIIMGFGFGFNLGTLLMMVPLVVKQEDMPVTMGAVSQIRVLGGTIGLAVCSAVLSSHVNAIPQGSSHTSHMSERWEYTQAYADGYTQQMRAMLYFCFAALVSLLLLAERHPRKLQTREDGELAAPVE
ncbi:major facilitator superfamily transporter [Triangularia verruculosa]|uniref:Major facilitator superfamily transporter n=1 Tax=Triangularia verruculosa TaxID=2587418 RepID=A0AAN6XB19_9PEZI|nr:major facilitator superfamily transporter [Triangularia verruculosa]